MPSDDAIRAGRRRPRQTGVGEAGVGRVAGPATALQRARQPGGASAGRARRGLRGAARASCRPSSRRSTAPERRPVERSWPPGSARLDAELVRRGLARSREQAVAPDRRGPGGGARRGRQQGGVRRRHRRRRCGCEPTRPIPGYASRGGHKLAGALDAFPALVVAGRRCLDAGASTGGFTDVLLRRGAREVVAVDVGYGQLSWALQTDERVRIHDRTNVRGLEPEHDRRAGRADGRRPVVHLAAAGAAGAGRLHGSPDGDLLPMVKPQFEVGKERLGSGGVVRDPALRAGGGRRGRPTRRPRSAGTPAACARVRCPGPSGNVEFFLWLRREPDAVLDSDAMTRAVVQAEVRWARDIGDAVGADRRAHRTAHHLRAGLARRPATARGGAGGPPARRASRRRSTSLASTSSRPTSAATGTEAVLVLGGDGTFLRAAELARPAGVPMVGVNLGHVGFLAEAEPNALTSTVDAIVAGQLRRRGAGDRRRRGPRRRGTVLASLGAERGVARADQPRADARDRGRRRRAAAAALRLRRDPVRHADRLDRVRVLGRRSDRLAERRRADRSCRTRRTRCSPAR